MEGTYIFHALRAEIEFNTTASVNSNGELEGISSSEPSGLIVKAAASKSILQNNKQPPNYTLPRSSEMLSGALAKLLANEQRRLVRPDGKTYGHMILHAKIAVLHYAHCDTLIPELIPSPEIHYKVNLSQTIGGVNSALCDRGANGCIKGNDMRVLYYNSD